MFLRKAGGSSNGRTAAFEAVNEGPIPSPPALRRSMVGSPACAGRSNGRTTGFGPVNLSLLCLLEKVRTYFRENPTDD